MSGIERTDYQIAISSVNLTKLNNSGIDRAIFNQPPTISAIASVYSIGAVYIAQVFIKELKDDNPTSNADGYAEFLKGNYERETRVSDLQVATRAIDGTMGAIASMGWIADPNQNPIESYEIIYNSTFDPNHVIVQVISLFLWDKGTLQLLKTLHVQRYVK